MNNFLQHLNPILTPQKERMTGIWDRMDSDTQKLEEKSEKGKARLGSAFVEHGNSLCVMCV